MTKRLRACVCVLGSPPPPVVILWCSFCGATKQFVLSLMSIWHICFSLNTCFGHNIFSLPIERAFYDLICRK